MVVLNITWYHKVSRNVFGTYVARRSHCEGLSRKIGGDVVRSNVYDHKYLKVLDFLVLCLSVFKVPVWYVAKGFVSWCAACFSFLETIDKKHILNTFRRFLSILILKSINISAILHIPPGRPLSTIGTTFQLMLIFTDRIPVLKEICAYQP